MFSVYINGLKRRKFVGVATKGTGVHTFDAVNARFYKPPMTIEEVQECVKVAIQDFNKIPAEEKTGKLTINIIQTTI